MYCCVIHLDAQVICPGYEVAAPLDVVYGPLPRVQNGVLAAKPSLHESATDGHLQTALGQAYFRLPCMHESLSQQGTADLAADAAPHV